MQLPINLFRIVLASFTILSVVSCSNVDKVGSANSSNIAQTTPTFLPFSDQQNKGNWIYNMEVSDEFDGKEVNQERWFIVGQFENGVPVYKHPDLPNKRVWKGRAPSQFSGRNYRLENGKLILETRWEPDFPFTDEIRTPVFGDPLPHENITTACFISRKFFKYGYIEIKSKAADAEITSAFWSMGEKLEIDFFEQFGDHRDPKKEALDQELWWSLRDWNSKIKDSGKPVYSENKDLGFRVADDFHVYGFEWSESGFKYYVDGNLLSEVSIKDVHDWAQKHRQVEPGYNAWVADRPISLWLDQETFPWHGIPDSKEDLEKNSPQGKKEDGIVDFEIEYVRVWQTREQMVNN